MHKITVKDVSKKFGERTIVEGVNAQFTSGHIYGLVGRNGSGKTVFLKCVCGFMGVTDGEIDLDGKVVKKDMEFLENMGFLIEHPGFLDTATGFENLKYLASVRRIAGKEKIEESIRRVGLDPHSKKKVGTYSMGMKQRLGIAQAIMEDPDICILDEPMNGLDDSGVDLIRNLLLELKQDGKVIILASHFKEDISLLCDEVYAFGDKHMIRQDTPTQ